MSDHEPTERELEALKVLWDAGESAPTPGGATVREVVDAMNETGQELAYTTVLSLLQVMEQKGLVDHVRHGKAYVYRPLIQRTSTYRRLAGGFLEKVFDGALGEYLVHALEGRKVSSEELDELEAMIADARTKQGVNKRAKKSPSSSTPRRRKKGGPQ